MCVCVLHAGYIYYTALGYNNEATNIFARCFSSRVKCVKTNHAPLIEELGFTSFVRAHRLKSEGGEEKREFLFGTCVMRTSRRRCRREMIKVAFLFYRRPRVICDFARKCCQNSMRLHIYAKFIMWQISVALSSRFQNTYAHLSEGLVAVHRKM